MSELFVYPVLEMARYLCIALLRRGLSLKSIYSLQTVIRGENGQSNDLAYVLEAERFKVGKNCQVLDIKCLIAAVTDLVGDNRVEQTELDASNHIVQSNPTINIAQNLTHSAANHFPLAPALHVYTLSNSSLCQYP